MTSDKIYSYLLKRNSSLKDRLKKTKKRVIQIETELNILKSTNYFHLWRFYCYLKEKFLHNEN